MRLAPILALAALLLAVASPAAAQLIAQRSTQTITTSGSDCTTAAACAAIADVFRTLNGTVDLSGTFTGTAQFEGTIDGTNWRALSVTPLAGGTAVTSATAVGAWTYVAALVGVRVRASALASGSIVVSLAAR